MRKFAKPEPALGDIRIKRKFLFFPKTIGLETRWLERTSWVEECQTYLETSLAIPYAFYVKKFRPIRWDD